MLPQILIAIVSLLVAGAEKLLTPEGDPATGKVKHDWVQDMVRDVANAWHANDRLPDWIKPEEDELLSLISDAIEVAIDKMEPSEPAAPLVPPVLEAAPTAIAPAATIASVMLTGTPVAAASSPIAPVPPKSA